MSTTLTPPIGAYVLATKYSDGDPGDPWAVGIYAGLRWGDRHMVTHVDGTPIRPSGFRHVRAIRLDVGRWMLAAARQLENSPPGTVNLWTMLADDAFVDDPVALALPGEARS